MPLALVVVGDGECDLRSLRVAKPREVRDGHDPSVDETDERTRFPRVCGRQGLDQPWAELRKPVKPSVQALPREAAEELEQRVSVVRTGRAQAQCRAVSKDDVEGIPGDRGHGAHLRAAKARTVS